LDFVFRSMVQRIVHNRSLLLERILGVDGVSTSSGKTAANNSGNDNTNENTSTDGGGNGSGAGEKVGASLNVVAASVVGALVLVTTILALVSGGGGGASGWGINFVLDTRLTNGTLGVSIFVEHALFGVFAGFGFVLATSSRITSVISAKVTIITVNRSCCANTINAQVIGASIEIIANNRNDFTSLAFNATLRAAFVSGWASLG